MGDVEPFPQAIRSKARPDDLVVADLCEQVDQELPSGVWEPSSVLPQGTSIAFETADQAAICTHCSSGRALKNRTTSAT